MLMLGSNGSSEKRKGESISGWKNSMGKTRARNFNLCFENNSAFEVFLVSKMYLFWRL